MSRLASLSSKPELQNYAQKLAAQRVRARANFLAPTVEVANPVGRFKKYTEKNRFRTPFTRRPSGGRATEITFTAEDATYNCEYHAIDVPIDRQEVDAAEVQSIAMESMDLGADVQALSHERDVITAALAAAGAGTDSNFTSDTVDPVALIDEKIEGILKATAGTMGIRLAFGPTAFRRFKNNAKVRSRFKVGRGAGSASAESITMESVRPLFLGEPELALFMMVEDTEPEGKDSSFDFLLSDQILIFATSQQPTRYDAGFMKTFRKMGQWMRPRFYERDDGRVEVTALDWSEDVQVTNTLAIARINANAS